MTQERMFALSEVAKWVNVERMISLMTNDEIVEMWKLTSYCNVNTNILNQTQQFETLRIQSMLFENFGGWKLIREVNEKCYNVVHNNLGD